MPFAEPSWWYGSSQSWQARLLQPVASVYGAIATRRYEAAAQTGYRSRLPVICIGNLTAGGTGKTPISISVARVLMAMGERPGFLTRGYGGRLEGPELLHSAHHDSMDAGDEALLLARAAPVMIAKDRAAGARAFEAAGDVSVIVMDDGLQNAALVKDLAFAVIDRARGLGNGRVIPAGPCREPVAPQAARIDSVIINGAIAEPFVPANDLRHCPQALSGKPMLSATVAPLGDVAWLRDARVVAFAGIANPQRFYDLVVRLGGRIESRHTFADHARLSDRAAADLMQRARASGATLVTTEKDWVRLAAAGGPIGELKIAAKTLPVSTQWLGDSETDLRTLLTVALRSARTRCKV